MSFFFLLLAGQRRVEPRSGQLAVAAAEGGGNEKRVERLVMSCD